MLKHPFVCISCGKEGLAHRKSKKKCDSCRRPNKTSICEICRKTYILYKSPKVICLECLSDLLSKGMIWCRECKKISECGGALSKKSLRCKQHEWLKRKEWRDSAKKKGRTRKKGPDIYKSQSLQERNLIADAFEHSLSYIQIAQKLKVTPGRVRSAIKSGFASPPINNKKQGRYGWLTSSDIEKIMGWDKQTIRRNRKFIGMNPYGVSRNNSSGPNSYIIKIEKFEAWLRKKEFWMLWEVDDILDPFWRNHCLTFRDGKEFWLWYGHAEKIIFYSRSSIFSWIKQKKLPATSILGRWYVWNSDLRDYMLKNYGMKVEI